MLDTLNEYSVKALTCFGRLFCPTIVVLVLIAPFAESDELTHVFKSPSFSGANTSSHYLTIENQALPNQLSFFHKPCNNPLPFLVQGFHREY